ncbi:MAG TPA: prolyl oligopeptidase family serine peptidase [Euzebyales bacterium]|nr:prolyl oligopeptidase family serine peptidase [Euzebyales bacterium]
MWARHAHQRLAYTTNASGIRQLWSWDRATGRHTQLTDKPTGVSWGVPTPDGDRVVWFNDTAGDEVGRFVASDFAGGSDVPLAAGVPPGWAAGCSLRRERSALGRADGDGFAITIVEDGRDRTIIQRVRPVSVAGLSADATLLALSHTEHGDVLHPTVEVVDPDGGPVAAVTDGAGNTITAAGWSPVRGDARLALIVEHGGRRQAEVWDVRTGTRTPCHTDLPGEVDVEDWWPDGSALLLAHEHEGRRTLLRHDLEIGRAAPVELGAGTVGAASVRPDGALWYSFESSSHPPSVRSRCADRDTVLLTPPGDPAPAGTAYRSVHYANGDGDQVHAFLAEPSGGAPYPLVVEAHGGPHWHVSESFDPFVQAWVDHGFAVLMPNYRGSTGYGKRWHDALEGDPGRPELVDLLAGRDHLVAAGVADPDRVVLTGGSWGGYLTLLGVGTQPAAWSAAVAIVPVADYVAAYEDESPGLQEFDRGLFGGTPAERGELFRERSPITYAAQVRAPVLIITGANDTRCPRRQVDNYVNALREHGVAHHYDVYEAGHGSMAIAENIRQQQLALDFVADHLGTPPAAR